jgi:hypothetical protein
MCSSEMTKQGYQVFQYVVTELMVAENIKYRCNPYINYLSLINRQDEFRRTAEANLVLEVRNFVDRIKIN